jgi:hypothetical protein
MINSKYLMIFIHCRPIYGTDTGVQDKGFSQTLIVTADSSRSPASKTLFKSKRSNRQRI